MSRLHVVSTTRSHTYLVDAESVEHAEMKVSDQYDPPLDDEHIYWEGYLGEMTRDARSDGIALCNP